MKQMPIPADKQGVQRLLGVANYFSKYLPSLSQRTSSLRSLIKHDAVFAWTPNHTHEWHSICDSLGQQPLLAIFDPQKETKVTSDASMNGLGSALMQRHGSEWRPVAYASRVLTDAEQRYSQIEKEALAVTFGCQKFHYFIYGRQIVLETDHQPLIAIAQKAIADIPPRLQRFFYASAQI